MSERFEVLEEETHYPSTHPKRVEKQAASQQPEEEEKQQQEETLEQQLERLVLSLKKDEGEGDESEDKEAQDAARDKSDDVKRASQAKELGNKWAATVPTFDRLKSHSNHWIRALSCRFFSRGSFLDAIECYTTALKLCPAEDEYAYNRVRDSYSTAMVVVGVGWLTLVFVVGAAGSLLQQPRCVSAAARTHGGVGGRLHAGGDAVAHLREGAAAARGGAREAGQTGGGAGRLRRRAQDRPDGAHGGQGPRTAAEDRARAAGEDEGRDAGQAQGLRQHDPRQVRTQHRQLPDGAGPRHGLVQHQLPAEPGTAAAASATAEVGKVGICVADWLWQQLSCTTEFL
ncbi:hypothetical protein ON010_g17320 [Phytophthora cinnamomi]|nr:hypothetical protein ON010_g17320 [Phytophthora cinnamomi]